MAKTVKRDEEPKSAYEIAMEKLRQRDREGGGGAPAALSDEQKREIAGIRKVYEARLAEREILHKAERRKVVAAGDPEVLEKLEDGYRRDRRRIEEERDARIEKVRAGSRGATL